jgi:hypothetical protein
MVGMSFLIDGSHRLTCSGTSRLEILFSRDLRDSLHTSVPASKSIGLHQTNLDSENAEQSDLWWSSFIIDVSLAISLSLALLTTGIETHIFHSRQTLSASLL